MYILRMILMNKFTKTSIAVLLSLFLASCDNVSDTTKSTTEENKPAVAVSVEQGIIDFKKILDWKAIQEQSLNVLQIELEQRLATQEPAQIQDGLKVFISKIEEILKSLDSLDIQHADVVTFKLKIKESLVLLSELIDESIKIMPNVTVEGQKAIQDKTEKVTKISNELQILQTELQQRFDVK